MSAEAIVKQEQVIILEGHELAADAAPLVANLTLPASVAISFRHVGAMDVGFLGALVDALAAAGAESVRAIEATPHEAKFLKLATFAADLPFAA